MKDKIYSVLKGKLLLSDDAAKNWGMLLFLSVLAMVMIWSAHSADRKIHEIAAKNSEVKEFRTRFVDGRSRLMQLQLESNVKQKLSGKGIKPSTTPPFKLVVKNKEIDN